MRHLRESVDGVGEAAQYELTHGEAAPRIDIHVPPGSAVLVAAIDHGSPHRSVIQGGRIGLWRLSSPTGRVVTAGEAKLDSCLLIRNSNETPVAYIELNPEPGTWTMQRDDNGGAASMHVATFQAALPGETPSDRRERLIRAFTCRSCKFLLKSLIFALIAQLTVPMIVSIRLGDWGAVILPFVLREAIQRVLALATGGFEKVLSIIAEVFDEPLADILKRLCQAFYFCKPGEVQVTRLDLD